MTIWLLTILLLVGLAALGFRQGVIRVVMSFLGIVMGGLLAAPLGHLLKPLVSLCGLKHPMWLTLLPPCIGFLIVLTIFKIGGFVINKKVEGYYRYKVGDLQLAMWERLNHRLGLCLGLLNGAAYMVLVSLAVYLLSYWTYQMATPESDPKSVQFLNRLGKDLETTGMSKVAVAVDKADPAYYQSADIVGLIYHNPLLQARVSRYPAFLTLAERPEFQDLANDTTFTELQMKQAPIMEMLNYPKVQAIVKNPELIKTIQDTVKPNLPDLRTFLETGKSANFSEPILGRWDFDVTGTMALVRKAKPNLTAAEALKMRNAYRANFAKTTFVAAPGDMAIIKNFPHVNLAAKPPTIDLQKLEGHWSNPGTSYSITLSIEGKDQQFTAEIQNDRLAMTSPELNFGFVRED